ncbi:MAG: potassium channel family protein [Planctomycetota bacterium]|nr:potassium channel family protein [Planctomycetota bacterium]
MWWSFTTVLTGGFGDIHNPVSVAGQVLTAVLVVTGMVFVGVFTATLTSLFVGEQSEEAGRYQDELGEKLETLTRRVEELGRRSASADGDL